MTDKYDDYYDSESQHASALAACERDRQRGWLRRCFPNDPSKWGDEEPTWEDEEPNAFWGLVITFLMIVLSALALFTVCMVIYHVMLPSFYWTIGQIGRLIGDVPAVFLGWCLWLSTLLFSYTSDIAGDAHSSGEPRIIIFAFINAVAVMREMISPWGG